jgi:hypothetical protein
MEFIPPFPVVVKTITVKGFEHLLKTVNFRRIVLMKKR